MGTGASTAGTAAASPKVDFFVSYAGVDEGWATWIAWVLEDAGYATRIQAWDFGAGSHFTAEMHRASRDAVRTVAVLSVAYLTSSHAEAEWQAAWTRDPTGELRTLLVFRIEDCGRPGLLGQVFSVDLFGLNRDRAVDRVVAAARGQRGKPAMEPAFPGGSPSTAEPNFPGALSSDGATLPSEGRSVPSPASGLKAVRTRPAILGLSVSVALVAMLVLSWMNGFWQQQRSSGGISVPPSRPSTISPGAISSSPVGKITSPIDGTRVPQCSYFSGTSQLPPGSTLILAMSNLSQGHPAKYVELVFNWQEPGTLANWRGAQYFGQPDDIGGQRYSVELMAIDLKAAAAARTVGGDAVNALAAHGTVLDVQTVVRRRGVVSNNCEGP